MSLRVGVKEYLEDDSHRQIGSEKKKIMIWH
jgi:hypothetical protein